MRLIKSVKSLFVQRICSIIRRVSCIFSKCFVLFKLYNCLYFEKKRKKKILQVGSCKNTAGVGRIGQVCLQKWAGLVKSVSRSEQDLSRVSEGVRRLAHECLQVWAGWVKSV